MKDISTCIKVVLKVFILASVVTKVVHHLFLMKHPCVCVCACMYLYMWLFVCSVISSCIQLLVQDLEAACEPALTAMSKVGFQSACLPTYPCVCLSVHLSVCLCVCMCDYLWQCVYLSLWCVRMGEYTQANSTVNSVILSLGLEGDEWEGPFWLASPSLFFWNSLVLCNA